VLGGGMDNEQGIGREIFRGVRAGEVNALVEKILSVYSERHEAGESFVQWTRKHTEGQVQDMLS
jgi:ferredoxin-nitrite reductase